MKQQTAVEWLQEAMSKKLTNEISPSFLDLFDQAKAMEKEQIMNDYQVGFSDGEAGYKWDDEDPEQYYIDIYQTP